MKDEAGGDDKVVAVCRDDPRLEEVLDYSSVPKHLRREIEEFFNTYKQLERGKSSEVAGWADREAAFEIIREAIEFYDDNRIK
jgi:inorganic pyrophosphatase